jgi:hypothetical protein
MLPVQPWLAAMNIESTLPNRPPHSGVQAGPHSGVRRIVGRGLIALGVALAGTEQTGRTVSVAR